jgi:hypothetical protein
MQLALDSRLTTAPARGPFGPIASNKRGAAYTVPLLPLVGGDLTEFFDLKKAFDTIFSRPIAFHAALGRLAGGATAGLMLSQACFWSGNRETEKRDGWFYKTQEEWEEETCLTRREQETARKHLRSKGYLEEARRGVPAKLWYKVNYDKIWQDLCQSSLWENANPEWRKAPIKSGGNEQSLRLTENTTKNTSENTHHSFGVFWDDYPRKVGREQAMKLWEAMAEDQRALALVGLKLWKQADQWNRDDGKYVPYASTFLRQRRWADEPWTGAFENSRHPDKRAPL